MQRFIILRSFESELLAVEIDKLPADEREHLDAGQPADERARAGSRP